MHALCVLCLFSWWRAEVKINLSWRVKINLVILNMYFQFETTAHGNGRKDHGHRLIPKQIFQRYIFVRFECIFFLSNMNDTLRYALKGNFTLKRIWGDFHSYRGFFMLPQTVLGCLLQYQVI